MGPAIDQVRTDTVLPEEVDIAVIGGGIIGIAAALSLARHGVRVALFEKGKIAGEQSSRNWGWVRQCGRDAREMPLIVESLRHWRTSGLDTGFRQCGTLYVVETDEDERHFTAWAKMAAPYGTGARMVTGAEAAALLPGCAASLRSGLYVPSDGCAEPALAAPAMARAAQALGVQIFAPCAVRGLETTAGRVSAVVTEHGKVRCHGAILAGGAWSSLFCGSLGIRLPQLKTLSSVQRTDPVPGIDAPCAWFGAAGYRQRADGGYTLAHGSFHVSPITPDSFRYFREFWPSLKQEGWSTRLAFNAQSRREFTTKRRWRLDRPSPFEAVRTLDPPPNKRSNRLALSALRRLYPHQPINIAQEWAGYIDVTPDLIPYIGGVQGFPGLVVATGFSGHGFGISPGAGQLAAELALGLTPCVDPTPFRVGRFEDGSSIVLGAEV